MVPATCDWQAKIRHTRLYTLCLQLGAGNLVAPATIRDSVEQGELWPPAFLQICPSKQRNLLLVFIKQDTRTRFFSLVLSFIHDFSTSST